MTSDAALPFGERVVSWRAVWDWLDPAYAWLPLHDDTAAEEMHRLRGMVMAQAGETEAVLGRIIHKLAPQVPVSRRTAGQLLQEVRRLMGSHDMPHYEHMLANVEQAIQARNHAVHSTVEIGLGGPANEPVISLMNDEEYNECDLRRDLALQQNGTTAAVQILYQIVRRDDEDADHPNRSDST